MRQRALVPRQTKPKAPRGTDAPARARSDLDHLDAASVLLLQRQHGNDAVATLLVQRQPKAPPGTRDVGHPENFPTYEGWLASFGVLPTFPSEDKVEAVSGKDKVQVGSTSSHKVYGTGPASKKADDPTEKKALDPIGPVPGDPFIDHPTSSWVKDNLPDELQLTAYQLPTNCADLAVVLRHVWLFKHNRSETFKGFVVGVGAGSEAKADRANRVLRAIGGISTENVAGMVNAYADGAGRPLRSLAVLGPMLHPGDILVWAHHEGPPAGPTQPRSGGHTQTIVSIERKSGIITEITALQGNQPLSKDTGTKFRYAPGRRIEQGVLGNDRLNDTTVTVRGKSESVWIWGDGHTTLVAAGPPRSAERPAAAKEGGQPRRHLADWLPAIARADRSALLGVVEASMREALAMLEHGDPLPELEGEARALARAAAERIVALDADLAKKRAPADPTLKQSVVDLLKVLATGDGSTKPKDASFLFGVLQRVFGGGTAEAGWSGVAPANINFGERMVGHVRRLPLDGLPGDAPRAVVAVPVSVDGGKRPVDVLLHFHGWGPGFTAGRDTTTDRIEAQLAASGGRMVAVLPQGGTKSEFGSFQPDAYLSAVFARLQLIGVWGVRGTPPRGRVVITGHSGGGKAAMDLVTSGASLGKGRLAEVALFDGINGPDELAAAEQWMVTQLDRAAGQLQAPAVKGKPAKEDTVLAGVVRFRAYHSGAATAKPSKKIRDWPGLHASLRKTIDAWFADHRAELSPRAWEKLRERIQVIATGQAVHENMVGGASKPGAATGALQDALSAVD